MNSTVRSIIADKIMAALETGSVAQWVRPWRIIGRPRSLAYNREYRGVNAWLLSAETLAKGYGSPYWTTYRQATTKGGHVRAGEKSTPVLLWKRTTWKKETDSGVAEERQGFVARYFSVFNTDQCEGLEVPAGVPVPIVGTAQGVLDAYVNTSHGPTFKHGGDKAFYAPSADAIVMPRRDQFDTPAGYYGTAFHECIHSTGHASRLDRDGVTSGAKFASHAYSEEELCAEFGAAMLLAEVGLEPTCEDSIAYIAGWKSKLTDDPGVCIVAASRADHAAAYVIGTNNNAGAGADSDSEAGE